MIGTGQTRPASAPHARPLPEVPITWVVVHDLPPSANASEHTVLTTTIAAPVKACFDVGLDLEAYPEWVQGIRSATVLERDPHGRPLRARFEASAIGRQSSYVLAYDLSGAPARLSWTMVEGDLTTRLEGAYHFEAVVAPDGDEWTDVTYELRIDLAVPLPPYVRRRAEDKIVNAALDRFKERIEATISTPSA